MDETEQRTPSDHASSHTRTALSLYSRLSRIEFRVLSARFFVLRLEVFRRTGRDICYLAVSISVYVVTRYDPGDRDSADSDTRRAGPGGEVHVSLHSGCPLP